MTCVDFFIIGGQKCGTTALDFNLRQNPSVQMSDVKEIHFFDNESVDWSQPDYSSFHEHFEWRDDVRCVRGEATPIYMYWPNAMERLRRYNSAAKLIVLLRHPGFRAHSHWRMETKRGWETMSFEEAVSEAGRRRVREAPGGVHRVYSFVERGFYAGQIRRLLKLFPAEQLLFLRTDDLWAHIGETLSRIGGFLEVGSPACNEASYVVPLRTDEFGAISAPILARLNKLFEADIAETAAMTGLSLADWLAPHYREPMITPDRQSEKRLQARETT